MSEQPVLQAVLWDLDGTIVQSESLWAIAETEILKQYGLELTDEIRSQMIGSGLWSAAEIFRKAGIPLSADEIVESWSSRMVELYHEQGAVWKPGALELLKKLKDSGIPNVLVTMSTEKIARAVIELMPENFFDEIVTGCKDLPAKPKPDPYLLGAEKLGVPIENCIAVEDSQTGLRSAVASGAVAIGVEDRIKLDQLPAHIYLSSLEEIQVETLQKWHTELAGVEATIGAQIDGRTNKRSAIFQYGDRVQLTGPKDKKYSFTLELGGQFHTQHGRLFHDQIAGSYEGTVFRMESGHEYLAFRPLLRDFVITMPRGAAIVYPKDAAQIISLADIGPGMRVVEAGVGSGALTISLLRALAGTGHLHSVERREEFAKIASNNVSAYFTEQPANWSVSVGELQNALAHIAGKLSVDRVILDMLAPWECVEEVAKALAPGGVVLAYVATVTQLSRFVEQLRLHGAFTEPHAEEVLVRTWHVEGLAVRPDHRMVGHTGFLVCARRLAPGAVLPQRRTRPSKTQYTDEDLAVWTPDLVGERVKSAKVLRKKVRESERFAQSILKNGTKSAEGGDTETVVADSVTDAEKYSNDHS